jgi:hypothetical protein
MAIQDVVSVSVRINVLPDTAAWLVDILLTQRIALMLRCSIIIRPACTHLVVHRKPDISPD